MAVRPPLLVVGVDGGERRVLETLWGRGELPALRALAERGSFLRLATDYGISPVIWTTIATGVEPAEHGITDFVVATESGDVPVSSRVRRRPALWNMLSRAHRRSATLGWWATWPAEEVEGLLLTDRAGLALGNDIWPSARAAELTRWVGEARAGGPRFGGNPASELQDRVVTLAARQALGEGLDLVLAYYRSVDLASHDHWHRFAPEDFAGGVPPDAAASAEADPVRDAYVAFDEAIASLLEAAPPETSVLIVSDHGFRAETAASLQLLLDFDALLERLGWLERAAGGGVDTARSRAWSSDSPAYRSTKKIRLRPGSDVERAGEELRTELGRVRFEGNRPAIDLRAANRRERRRGVDLVATVDLASATPKLYVDGRETGGIVTHHGRITGGHSRDTAGILIAAGPLFETGARVEASVRDLTPTILHALGLPVADDFSGVVLRDLLAGPARASVARRVPTWGVRETGSPAGSAADRRLLEELGALGYLK